MGYERQYYQTGSACMVNTKYYHADFIKDISENRFICGSNYGFKIYSLNEKNDIQLVYSKLILQLDGQMLVMVKK